MGIQWIIFDIFPITSPIFLFPNNQAIFFPLDVRRAGAKLSFMWPMDWSWLARKEDSKVVEDLEDADISVTWEESFEIMFFFVGLEVGLFCSWRHSWIGLSWNLSCRPRSMLWHSKISCTKDCLIPLAEVFCYPQGTSKRFPRFRLWLHMYTGDDQNASARGWSSWCLRWFCSELVYSN